MTVYKGFSTVNAEFSSSRLTDTNLIKQDLLNSFAIRKGEKLMNADFGSNLPNLVMEPLTEEVKNLILDEITEILRREPRIRVKQVLLDEFSHGVQVQLDLVFVTADLRETLVVRFNRENGGIL